MAARLKPSYTNILAVKQPCTIFEGIFNISADKLGKEADAPNLLKAFKSCKFPDLSSIRIAFANLYDLIHAVELVVDGYNIPGYTQSLSDKELINCITSYKKNRLAFDKGENLMNLKDPKTSVSKIAKLLGLFSACPKLQTIDLFSYAGSGMNFTFKQNGSNLETKLW